MIHVQKLDNLFNNILAASDDDALTPLANEMSPTNAILKQNLIRTTRQLQFTDLVAFLRSLLLVIDFNALAWGVIYSFAVLIVLSITFHTKKINNYNRKMIMTPWLMQVVSDSWDDLNSNTPLAR